LRSSYSAGHEIPCFRGNLWFTPCSRKPITVPYPGQVESSPAQTQFPQGPCSYCGREAKIRALCSWS